MSDITMCNGAGCPYKATCHRHTANPNPFRQSYFGLPPITGENKCAEYWWDGKSPDFSLSAERQVGKKQPKNG